MFGDVRYDSGFVLAELLGLTYIVWTRVLSSGSIARHIHLQPVLPLRIMAATFVIHDAEDNDMEDEAEEWVPDFV